MTSLSVILVLIVTNIIYTIGFLTAQILTTSPHKHYFLGFNPGIVTFSLRNIKFTLGVYIPIIGLSRIYSVDNVGEKHIFYPWQLTNTSLLKRLFITYSGVLSLFVFGVAMAIVAVYTSSERYITKEEVNRLGIYPSAQARAVGFRTGDQVVALNGNDYSDFYELIHPDVVQSPETEYTVLRGTQETRIKIGEVKEQREMFISLNAPFAVGKILPGSPAEDAGILEGDKIAEVNGKAIIKFHEMNTYFESDDDGEVLLEIERGDGTSLQRFEKVVTLNYEKKLGIAIDEKIEYKIKDYSLVQSVTIGTARFSRNLAVQGRAIKKMFGFFLPGQAQTLSGPIAINSVFANRDLNWWITLISVYTGFVIILNFLPLPKSAMLEVIPLGYEALAKKPFSYKSFRLIRQISIGFLVLLIVGQFVSDVVKLLL